MAAKAKYVFGFKLNKLYKHNNGKGHLLLIKAPRGAFKRIKLFCRFFRTFFIGFKKEKRTQNIQFFEFSKVTLEFETEQVFCLDGEQAVSQKINELSMHKEKLNIEVLY